MAHILIVSFHRGFPVDFARHIDHEAHTVSYLTDEFGHELLSRRATPARCAVVDPDDPGAVHGAVAGLVGRGGRLDVVCAPSEYDLDLAAAIRARFSVPGLTPEQTLRCQDKVLMKRALQERGLATPAFSDCRSLRQVRELIEVVEFPVVLKPRQGAASRGVVVVRDEAQLRAVWPHIDHQRYEAEEFISGPIYHVDGLVQDGELRFAVPAKYVNTCLQSTQGIPHGSFVVDDRPLRGVLTEFAQASLAALGVGDTAFHLEVIMRDGATPTFLEVGVRPGGAEVQQLIEDLYGVDLLREWVNLQLGPVPMRVAPLSPVGGWLVVPAPRQPPYEVVSATTLLGEIPFLYHQRVPSTGERHNETTLRLDRWPGGRFRYAGPSSDLVERSIIETIRRYHIAAAPLAAETAPLTSCSSASAITW